MYIMLCKLYNFHIVEKERYCKHTSQVLFWYVLHINLYELMLGDIAEGVKFV